MDFKSLITAGFAKGWRTYAIIAFVAIGVVLEQLLGLDIPKVALNWDDLILALGLGAAANHVTASS